MIRGWKTKEAREVFEGQTPKRFPPDLMKAVRRRLVQLEASDAIEDLRSPPGNRLRALTADRKSQWSISVKDQFRICFVWTEHGPDEVEFVNYQ